MNEPTDKNSQHLEGHVRCPQPLAGRVFRQLNEYSLAASAAGVALLALSVPVEAAPVCGSLSVTLASTETYAFNPAHQKVAPFNVAVTYNDASSHPGSRRARAFFTPNIPDAKVLTSASGLPLELSSGETIGSKGTFGKGQEYGLLIGYYYFNRYIANFQPNQSGYVGFHFAQSGQPHYGWLRVRVVTAHGPFLELSEFGYESAPNTAITAGNCAASAGVGPGTQLQPTLTEGTNSSNTGSLGLLALGYSGLPVWRGMLPGEALLGDSVE
jgi:hypothetical protein